MPSSFLRKMDAAAKKAERGARARTKAADREAKRQRQLRRRNLDVVGNTLGLEYQLVDQLIQPRDFPENLSREMYRKAMKKAARQAGNHVKKAIVNQIKSEGLDSRQSGTRELWSEEVRAYHEDYLGRKHLVQSIKVKVIDDKKEERIVVLVGPEGRQNAWYAWFLEFGWMHEAWGTGVVEAQPPRWFMTKAIKKSQGAASRIFVEKMKEFMTV